MSVEQREGLVADWSSEGYRSIFENAPIGIYRSTLDGRVLRANPALVALNGYSSEGEMLADLRTRGNEWYVEPGRREEFHRLMADHRETRNFVSEVYRMKTRDRAWVCENAWAIRDPEGRIRYFEGTVEDITAQQTARARIQEASQSLKISLAKESHFASLHSSLASIVAHQFRTPLAIIDSAAQRTARADRSLNAAGLDHRMQQIRSAVRRMNHLIDTVLSSARLEAGEIRPLLRRSNLHATIEEAVAEIREGHAHATFDICLTDLPIEIDMDPALIQQAIYNILSNAVKFSTGSPAIRIRGRLVGRFAVISINDNGVGIDEEDIPRLSQRFFRAKSAEGISGTGLGLSIARDLIHLHGGEVALESVRHEGTTVNLTLPVHLAGSSD